MNSGSTALIGLSYSMFGAVSHLRPCLECARPTAPLSVDGVLLDLSPSPRSTDSTPSPSPLRQRRLGRSTRTEKLPRLYVGWGYRHHHSAIETGA